MKGKVGRFLKSNVLIVFLVILVVVITVQVPRFLTISNVTNVLIQISINALIATGMTFVILTGGIDLSVGAVAALAGICVTYMIKKVPLPSFGTSILFIIGISIIVGFACGMLTALAVSKFDVTPFIATLAVQSIARGVCYVITNSTPIFQLPESFNRFGQGRILGKVPILVLVMILVMVISAVVLRKTPYGRKVYAIGNNEEVAYLSGVNLAYVKSSVYVISAILSALAGCCLASKLGTGQPGAANGYELDAVAAVVMAGTSLLGGKGGIEKTVIGVITIGVINNGLNLMQVGSYWQTIIMGIIILLAVILDQTQNKNGGNGSRK